MVEGARHLQPYSQQAIFDQPASPAAFANPLAFTYENDLRGLFAKHARAVLHE